MNNDSTTQFQRRVRHWKTTTAGIAIAGLTIAASVWPQHGGLFAKIIGGLSAAGLLAASDAPKQP